MISNINGGASGGTSSLAGGPAALEGALDAPSDIAQYVALCLSVTLYPSPLEAERPVCRNRAAMEKVSTGQRIPPPRYRQTPATNTERLGTHISRPFSPYCLVSPSEGAPHISLPPSLTLTSSLSLKRKKNLRSAKPPPFFHVTHTHRFITLSPNLESPLPRPAASYSFPLLTK